MLVGQGVNMATCSSGLLLDHIAYLGTFLTFHEVISSSIASKLWSRAMESETIWHGLYEREKIPEVSGSKEYKKNFIFLYPRTISARQMSGLGTFVGIVPKISKKEFTRYCNKHDPFDPQKKIHETFCIFVEPVAFKRAYHRGLALDLCMKGDQGIEIVDQDDSSKKEIVVPFSFKNIQVLTSHLLKECEVKVLADDNDLFLPTHWRFSNAPKIATLSIMRRHVPEESRGRLFFNQSQLMGKKGLESTPFITRFLFNVVEILNTKTCPDDCKSDGSVPTRSRAPEILVGADWYSHLIVGGYRPTIGLQIELSNEASNSIGIAPRFPIKTEQSSAHSDGEEKPGQFKFAEV